MAKSHVLSALKRRYAQTLDLAARGIAVGDDLEHLGTVILMFAPKTDLAAIRPIRRYHSREGRWTRAGVKYAELAKRLTDMGLPETEASVQVKINRGAFPAWFMLAAMKAIGATSLRLQN